MKITREFKVADQEILEIKSAVCLGDFVISIHFTNGKNKSVKFKPFLTSSLHPSIRKYLAEPKFKKFKITDGNLNWNDYELIFPIYDLYKGKI